MEVTSTKDSSHDKQNISVKTWNMSTDRTLKGSSAEYTFPISI